VGRRRPENPWFEWSENPGQPGDSVKPTPWGALPAYNKEAVREFITNHALHQLDEFHFDGLRFDFTHPIHSQSGGGGDYGWEMLQKINRTIDLYHPDAFTAAEEFPNHPNIVTPPDHGEQGGGGFDAMWNTEFQHRLVHDHGNPSVLQEAAHGHFTRTDKLLHHLLHQPGFNGPGTSVTVFSNHDEVGNADRTVNVANLHRDPSLIGEWEKSVTRTSMGVGFLSPGTPLMFQGDESLATNKFSWGIPSRWDMGWEWMDQPESPRYKHHTFSKALIALRKSSDAFDATAEAHRVYSHQHDSVIAFSRKNQGEEYLVVASFNKNDLQNYNIPTDARWEPVLNGDRAEFGGQEKFPERPLEYQQGTVDLPAGGLLVFRKT
jgi:maltooligosyltrehalose trehalohydrolase